MNECRLLITSMRPDSYRTTDSQEKCKQDEVNKKMAQSLLSATPALLPPSPRTLHKTFNGKHRISSLSSRFIKLRSVCSATNNHHPSLSGIRSGRFWSQFSVSPDIWSIKRDLKIPSSPYCNTYAQGSQGPPHDRIIRCGGPVDDEMAKFLIAQLLYLDAADPTRDIIMYINSPGGSVTAGMAIFDTMRHVRPDVATVCVGISASMGAFLLAAGTKGKRYSLSNSRIMIHQPLGGTQGQQTDVEIQANEILYHKANLAGYLAYFSGQTIERINTDTDRHYFMSPKQAKEYGLVDSVIMNPRCLLNQNQLLLDLVTLPKMI